MGPYVGQVDDAEGVDMPCPASVAAVMVTVATASHSSGDRTPRRPCFQWHHRPSNSFTDDATENRLHSTVSYGTMDAALPPDGSWQLSIA